MHFDYIWDLVPDVRIPAAMRDISRFHCEALIQAYIIHTPLGC